MVEKRSLVDVLAEDPAVTAVMDRKEIARTLAPENYLGAARTFIDRALAQHEAGTRHDR